MSTVGVIILLYIASCSAERIKYISLEHPAITHVNPVYVKYINLTSRRHSRGDPFYYVDYHVESLRTADDTIKVHIVFFELLTNVYKRSFIEMHFGACDFVKRETVIAPLLFQGNITCPLKPGAYHFYNITMKKAPDNFPFVRGRIYVNVTQGKVDIAGGYMDMELKELNTKKLRRPKLT